MVNDPCASSLWAIERPYFWRQVSPAVEYQIDASWGVMVSATWIYDPPVAAEGDYDHDEIWRSFSGNPAQFSAMILPRRKMKMIVDVLWTPIVPPLVSSRLVVPPGYLDNVPDHVVQESS